MLTAEIKALKAQYECNEAAKKELFETYNLKQISYDEWEKQDDKLDDMIMDVQTKIGNAVLKVMDSQPELTEESEEYFEVTHDPKIILVRFSGQSYAKPYGEKQKKTTIIRGALVNSVITSRGVFTS